jgi:hypothetical protein
MLGNHKWGTSYIVAFFFEKFIIDIFKFQKFETKILGVDNFERYHCLKCFRICCILGYTKIANLTNFQILRTYGVHHT